MFRTIKKTMIRLINKFDFFVCGIDVIQRKALAGEVIYCNFQDETIQGIIEEAEYIGGGE